MRIPRGVRAQEADRRGHAPDRSTVRRGVSEPGVPRGGGQGAEPLFFVFVFVGEREREREREGEGVACAGVGAVGRTCVIVMPLLLLLAATYAAAVDPQFWQNEKQKLSKGSVIVLCFAAAVHTWYMGGVQPRHGMEVEAFRVRSACLTAVYLAVAATAMAAATTAAAVVVVAVVVAVAMVV